MCRVRVAGLVVTILTIGVLEVRGQSSNPECGLQKIRVPNHRARIVRGRPAAECEYPWLVFISALNSVCAGAILDTTHVLTAAHCVKDTRTHAPLRVRVVQVLAGSSSLSSAQMYEVVNITSHPQHDPFNRINDAAVLTLARALVFSKCQAPICLPTEGVEPRVTDTCVVAGWGVTTVSGASSITPDLQQLDMSVVDQVTCQRSYSQASVNDRTFCARDYLGGRRDSCKGDSGAPLMCRAQDRWVVYGIVSSGLSCAQPAFPGIYTKVSHPEVLEFISMATSNS